MANASSTDTRSHLKSKAVTAITGHFKHFRSESDVVSLPISLFLDCLWYRRAEQSQGYQKYCWSFFVSLAEVRNYSWVGQIDCGFSGRWKRWWLRGRVKYSSTSVKICSRRRGWWRFSWILLEFRGRLWLSLWFTIWFW